MINGTAHQLGPRYEGQLMSEPIPHSSQSSSHTLTTLSSYVSTDQRAVTRYKIQNFIQTRYGNITNNVSYEAINRI